MAVFRDGGKAKQAADSLAKILENLSVPGNQELAFLEFAVATFDYLVISETLYVALIDIIIVRAIKLGAHEDVAAISVLFGVYKHARGRVKFAVACLVDALRKYLGNIDSEEYLFCLYVLGMTDYAIGDSLEFSFFTRREGFGRAPR